MKGRGILARIGLVVVAVGVGAVIPSCVSTPRLPVPERSAVGQLVVSQPSADGTLREFVIEDAQTVERFLNFLRTHNDGWRKPWDTFPSPQYTVALNRDKELLLVVWVGRDWLGGREGNGGDSDNRLRSFSDTERTELLEILGNPKDR